MPGIIAGCTPGIWGEDRQFHTRGEEIQQWLIENTDGYSPFVILDDMDDSEAMEGQKDKWIQVNPHSGITSEDSYKAIEILKML